MHPSRWTAGVGAIALFGSLGLGSSAQAATFTPPTVNVPVQLTNYTRSVSVPKFDPSLGVLQSVLLTFNGTVTGDLRVDNGSQSPATGELKLASELKLSQAALGGTLFPVITLNPFDSAPFSVTADDGDVNGTSFYTGTDSQITTGLQGSQSGTKSYTAAADAATLALFTGAGNVDFVIGAVANSSVISADSGNLDTRFRTSAGADFTITYTYDPPTRVPETSANFGVGLLAAGLAATQLKRISRLA